MAVITVPAIRAKGVLTQLVRGDIPLEKMSGAETIMQYNKAVWAMSIPMATQKRAAVRGWMAASAQLSKLGNTFKVTPPDYLGNSVNYIGNNPTVDGIGQLGLSLDCIVVGIPNTTMALAGDFIEVNGEFKILTADATSNGGNQVTFNFEPALRTDPPNGAEVDVKTPQVELRFVNPVATWDAKLADFYNLTLECVESLTL